MTSSPFGGTPAGGPEAATMGPFEAAALARGPVDAPFGALPEEPAGDSPAGFPPGPAAAGAPSPFGAVPAPRPAGDPAAGGSEPAAGVPEPAGLRARAVRPERPSLHLPSRPDGGSGASRRSPLLVIALGGGALVLGALVAGTVLSTTDDVDDSGIGVVPGVTAAPSASADPTQDTDALPEPGGGAGALGRDPFAALVASTGAPPTSTATPEPTPTGAPDTGDGSNGVVDGGTPGATPGRTSGGGTTTVQVPGPTVTVTAAPPSTTAPTALTTAQTCSAVSGPMAAVEQLLSSSSSGGAPVDTGTALRTPVAALRTAVGATSDGALASRLDVATSSAESLRAQLLGGVAVTPDQLARQTSLDAAVRTACS